MSERKCENWLKTYLEHTSNTESPALCNLWVGVSVLASVMQKRFVLHAGRLRIIPNLYIVLVGPPGSRKSQAINYGTAFLQALEQEGVKYSPNKITTEMLINKISKARKRDNIDGKDVTHTSFTVVSDEFESFLGYKGKNDSMIGFLTDIFGGGSPDYEYETLSRGKDKLVNPCINLLAATTASSLANSLPLGAIGGGLTSRIIFPTVHDKAGKIAFPQESGELFDVLLHDLRHIIGLSGKMRYSPEAAEKWIEYYEKRPETHDPQYRICKHPLFNYWYERKFLFIQKLAMILQVANSDERVIPWERFEKAIQMLEEIERCMGDAFDGVGENPAARKMSLIKTHLWTHKVVTKRELLQSFWQEINLEELDNILHNLVQSGAVVIMHKTDKDKFTKDASKHYIALSENADDLHQYLTQKK